MSNFDISEEEVLALLPPQNESWLSAYVHYAMECTDAHAIFHLGTGLALLAQTVPTDYGIPFAKGVMPANLYVLNVGPSTRSRKSESINTGRDILQLAVPDTCGDAPGSKENLITSLTAREKQLVFYSEFGSFLANTAGNTYLMPLRMSYTEAWDGTPLTRALVKSTQKVTSPRLSLLCGSTPDFLEVYTKKDDWTGGFMSRFLTFWGDRKRSFSWPKGSNARREHIAGWLQTYATFGAMHKDKTRVLGKCLGRSREAEVTWDNWYNMIENMSGRDILAGPLQRSVGHAVRVAALLSWDIGNARDPGSGPNQPKDWHLEDRELRIALGIIDLHVRSLRRLDEALVASRDMRERRDVLAAVRTTPTPLAEIMRGAQLMKVRAQIHIESLIEEQEIEAVNEIGLYGQHFQRKKKQSWRTDVGESPFGNVVSIYSGSSSESPNSSDKKGEGGSEGESGT